MPITYSTGSIFDSPANVLVCPVNCVGVMGKGLAKEFAKRWPKLEDRYKEYCELHRLAVGYPKFCGFIKEAFILFPTKQHWRDLSRIEWIGDGLYELANHVLRPSETVALPALGCGLGGLAWPDVKALIEKYFGDSPIDATVYLPTKEMNV